MVVRRSLALAASFGALVLASAAVEADDLTIGLAVPPTTMDPHFQSFGQNNSQSRHIFDTLIHQGDNQELTPGLAVSWRPLDDTTWEFKLREGVTFHDGSPFTAEDVAFTMERAPNVPDSPNSFSQYTKAVKKITVVDPMTIHVETVGPSPLLPNDLANIWIISKKHGEGAIAEDYNLGPAMVGTGPYQFVSWQPGEKVVYKKYPDYWGGEEPWDNVTFLLIPSGPARAAALLAGDVDVISDVPTIDVDRLEQSEGVSVWAGPANRVVFMVLDVNEGPPNPEFLQDSEGAPMEVNPLADQRVRKALSLAIDRETLTDRVMAGQAVPTSQFVPEGFFGYLEGQGPDAYDPEKARELLAEAGYPDGFRATIASSNNRIINAVKYVQAVAQMWTRIGVETGIETMPHSVFSPRRGASEFPIFFNSQGNSTGEASSFLVANFHTRDNDAGLGTTNRHRYSNPEMDQLIEEALRTIDDEKRLAMLQEGMRIAVDSAAYLPFHFQMNIWGSRDGLVYHPRTDGNTLAMNVRRTE